MGEPYDQAETLDPFARDKVLFTRLNAALARALEELGYFTSPLKILGVYPADPLRATQG